MLLRGLVHATNLDPGFDRHDVIAVSPRLTLSGYDSLKARVFMADFAARVGSLNGVRAVTRGNVPIENWAPAWIARPDEAPPSPGTRWNGSFNAVSETFFDALGTQIVRGRGFTQAEVRSEAPVVIVSETTARTLWPNMEAIGQVVSVRPAVRGVPGRPREGLFESARVIGVARDAQVQRLTSVPRRHIYLPGDYWTLMLRRTPGDEEVMTRLRDLARSIDPGVVLHTRSLDEVIWRSTGWLSTARLTSLFAVTLGGLSLLMAVIGLFGLTAYAVEQRTREFGVRMALGAQAGSVLRLVVRQGVRLVVIGGVLGVAGGMAGSGVLRSMLFGVSPVDPLAYAAVILLLATVTTVACLVPALRATRVDPVVALRAD
jgi:putative ABC transport system permease protein